MLHLTPARGLKLRNGGEQLARFTAASHTREGIETMQTAVYRSVY